MDVTAKDCLIENKNKPKEASNESSGEIIELRILKGFEETIETRKLKFKN